MKLLRINGSIAMVAFYALKKGFENHSPGGTTTADASTVHSLLKGASSSSSFSQRMGYGWIDLLELYEEAIQEGYDAFSSGSGRCPPPPYLC